MKQSIESASVIDTAQYIVERVVPEELPFFSVVSKTYQRDPASLRTQQVPTDGDMGFGWEDSVKALAPSIVIIVEQIFVKIGSEASKKGAASLFRLLRRAISRRASSRKQKKQPASPAYTLDNIRSDAYAAARKLRVTEKKAIQIADALVERLQARRSETEDK
jgi:hypothetical protein